MLVWYTSLTDFHCLIAGVVDKNIYSQLFSNVVSDLKKLKTCDEAWICNFLCL